MPRTLKRRSDAISRDEQDATPGPSRQAAARSRRSSSVSSVGQASEANSDYEGEATSTPTTNLENLAKKLIRLAISSEYSRTPIRRTDIIQKIFKDSNASPRLFKQVFTTAQTQLQELFGMKLIELPSREKITLKDRRNQAVQKSSTSTTAWILVSTLPKAYKTHPDIIQPALAPSSDTEASYTALYTFILSLIFLNNSSLTEAKLERYLKRVNADAYTPLGNLEKLLQRMVKDGYIEKRRDTTSGEEIVEYVPGPRGKVEVGIGGVVGLVRSVYGFGSVGLDGKHNVTDGETEERGGEAAADGNEDGNENDNASRPTGKIDREELEQRLHRSLGSRPTPPEDAATDAMEVDGDAQQEQTTKSKARRKRRGDPAEDEDDGDYHQ